MALTYGKYSFAWPLILKKLGCGCRADLTRKICTEAGAPADDTDIANADGDLCYDTTNDEVYVASNVADDTTTWTKLLVDAAS